MFDPLLGAGLRLLARRWLSVLLAVVFVAVQATALAHEIQHILHQHDVPCGLHVAADLQAMDIAHVPAAAVALPPAPDLLLSPGGAPPSPATRRSAARSPPRLF